MSDLLWRTARDRVLAALDLLSPGGVRAHLARVHPELVGQFDRYRLPEVPAWLVTAGRDMGRNQGVAIGFAAAGWVHGYERGYADGARDAHVARSTGTGWPA